MTRFITILSLFVIAACAPQVAKISGRNPDLFEKESDHLEGRARGTAESHAPEMYVKQKGIVIKDATQVNETGSLFNPDDERNYLFTATGPLNVGRFLRIKVVPNRADSKKKDDGDKGKGPPGAKDKGATADAKGGKDGKEAKPDEIEQELLKALPNLEPATKGDPGLLKAFKMQILHRYDNGDVLAMVSRRSTDDDQGNEVAVQARIPYDRLTSGEDLTTDDLLDVRYHESNEGELAERTSSGWEDEYSLRLSGFNEAKSKMAVELGDHQKQLKDANEKLEGRIKTFNDERKLVAKQREELQKQKKDTEEKITGLEDKVKEQGDTIEKQQEELQTLSPEDKQGDGKEGSG